ATHVGGETLSVGHGYPARLIAPDHRGFQWIKWVTQVHVASPMKMRRLFVLAVAGLAIVAASSVGCGVLSPGTVPGIPGGPAAQPAGGGVAGQGGAPLPLTEDISHS